MIRFSRKANYSPGSTGFDPAMESDLKLVLDFLQAFFQLRVRGPGARSHTNSLCNLESHFPSLGYSFFFICELRNLINKIAGLGTILMQGLKESGKHFIQIFIWPSQLFLKRK